MTARARIDRLRAVNPAAADLAALCALAVRVEPELLRRLRLLLPGADVTAETDLWAGDVLSAASASGVAVDPAVAEHLRADLRDPRWDAVRQVAGETVAASHAREHWSLRLEEQLRRLDVVGDPDGRRADLLLAALGELMAARDDPSAAVPAGIARWLLAALARLPGSVSATAAGTAARMGAGLHLGRAPETEGSDAAAWLPWLVERAGGGVVDVPVGFVDGVLSLGEGGSGLRVPRTEPLVVDAEWHDGRAPVQRRLWFAPGERVRVAVAAGQVELTTLDGAVGSPGTELEFAL